MKLLVIIVVLAVAGIEAAKEKAVKVKDKDMMRKMIIYDKVIFNSTVLDSFIRKWSSKVLTLLLSTRKIQTSSTARCLGSPLSLIQLIK